MSAVRMIGNITDPDERARADRWVERSLARDRAADTAPMPTRSVPYAYASGTGGLPCGCPLEAAVIVDGVDVCGKCSEGL